MVAGRPPDKVWASYAKPNNDPATKDKKPWVDIFKSMKHTKNATKFKLWLAFSCAEFMNKRPLEWQTLVSDLTAENVKSCKSEDKSTWRKVLTNARKQRRR